jgi:hypothetical protein
MAYAYAVKPDVRKSLNNVQGVSLGAVPLRKIPMVRSKLREAGEAAFEALKKHTEPSVKTGLKDDVRSKSNRLKELRLGKATASGDEDASERGDSAAGSNQPLDLFMFKSVAKDGLHAFAGDAAGTQLPRRFRPWKAQGVIGRNDAPPHRLSRSEIEKSIRESGFQLWQVRRQR